MKVDTTNCLGVPHDVAVEALKQSGSVVRFVCLFIYSNKPVIQPSDLPIKYPPFPSYIIKPTEINTIQF